MLEQSPVLFNTSPSLQYFDHSPLASPPLTPEILLWPDGEPVREVTERLASRFVLKIVAMLVLEIFLALERNLFNSLFCRVLIIPSWSLASP